MLSVVVKLRGMMQGQVGLGCCQELVSIALRFLIILTTYTD